MDRYNYMLEKSHSAKLPHLKSLKPIIIPTHQSLEPNRKYSFRRYLSNVKNESLKPIAHMFTKLSLDPKQDKLLLITYQDYRNSDLAKRVPIRPKSKFLRLCKHEDFTKIGCRYISNQSALEKKSFISFLRNSSISNQSTPISSAVPIMTPTIKVNCRINTICKSEGINQVITPTKQNLSENFNVSKCEAKSKFLEKSRIRRKKNNLGRIDKFKSKLRGSIMKSHSVKNIEEQSKSANEILKFHKKEESFDLTGWVS